MKWNYELKPDEKEKIILNYSGVKIGKKQLKKIAEKMMVCQKKDRDLTYTILRIPVAGDGFQTDGTIPEVADLDDSDIPECYRFIMTIDNDKGEYVAEAIGFEYSLYNFLMEPEMILNPLDAESYQDITAGMIMFDKLFPRTAMTAEAHGPLEKKIEQELITMNPSMIWPDLLGSPYNEKRVNEIMSVVENDDDLVVDDVLLITDMFLYPSKCKQIGMKMVSAILSTGDKFLYMTCDVATDGKFDSSLEKEMVSLAKENGMIVEGDDTKGYYGYLIDKGYTRKIEKLDSKK